MAKVICPSCGGESFFAADQIVYQGPYRCIQCKTIFNVRIENGEVKSCQTLSQQEIDKLKLRNPY